MPLYDVIGRCRVIERRLQNGSHRQERNINARENHRSAIQVRQVFLPGETDAPLICQAE